MDDEEDLEMILAENREGAHGEDQEERKAWSEWEEKIIKIVDVCKDYGLEDVLYSVCRVSNPSHMFNTNDGLTRFIRLVDIASTNTSRVLWTSCSILGDGEGWARCWPDRRLTTSRVHHKRYILQVLP